MAQRILMHGAAPTCSNVPLVPGSIRDLTERGQFLVDLEFLTRYSGEKGACFYTTAPSYLHHIAGLFEWLHFYAFSAQQEQGEYDPDNPGLGAPITMQTKGNLTISTLPFSKGMARSVGERSREEPMVMICHGEEPTHQMILQILSRPDYCLMDIGTMPEDYLEGELILPVFAQQNKLVVFLVAAEHAKAKTYDHKKLEEEMGFFQTVLRASRSYDDESRNLIVSMYSNRYSTALKWAPMITELNLRFLLERLSD